MPARNSRFLKLCACAFQAPTNHLAMLMPGYTSGQLALGCLIKL